MKKALIISTIIVISVVSSQVILANPNVFLDSAISMAATEIKYESIQGGTISIGFEEFSSMSSFEEFILENRDNEISTIIKIDSRDCSINLDDLDGNLFYEGSKVDDWEYTFDDDSYYFINIRPSGDEFNVFVELYGLSSYESGPEDPTRADVPVKCLGGDVSKSWVPSYSAAKEFEWSWDYKEGPHIIGEAYCMPNPPNEEWSYFNGPKSGEETFTCPSDFCEINSWYTQQAFDTLASALSGRCEDEGGHVTYYIDGSYKHHSNWDERTPQDPKAWYKYWCVFKEDSTGLSITMNKGSYRLKVRGFIDWGPECFRGAGTSIVTYKEGTKTCPSDAPNFWNADEKCHLRAEPE